ncbi:MAG: hypothetical protein QME66_13790, partial [Candidatus Eisenbacteria bacterium]|nr:hypothetical protein [Candidatus Eisenbacteria bacterium]
MKLDIRRTHTDLQSENQLSLGRIEVVGLEYVVVFMNPLEGAFGKLDGTEEVVAGFQTHTNLGR